jgi:hypothetical protein
MVAERLAVDRVLIVDSDRRVSVSPRLAQRVQTIRSS